MKTTKQALQEGFTPVPDPEISNALGFKDVIQNAGMDIGESSWVFEWQDGDNHYELMFEKLLWDMQYYVALYKNQDLMTEKVVVKPGFVKEEDGE